MPTLEFLITCNVDLGNGAQQWCVWNNEHITAIVFQESSDGEVIMVAEV